MCSLLPLLHVRLLRARPYYVHQGSGPELQAGTAGLGQRGEFINPLLNLLCLFH